MLNQKWIPYIFFILLGLGGIYLYLHKSPIEIALEKTKQLALDLSVHSTHNKDPIQLLRATNKVSKNFAPKFEIHMMIDRHQMKPITTHENLKQKLLILRKHVRFMTIKFTDLQTSEEGGSTVLVTGTVVINSSQRPAQKSPMEIRFSKFNLGWFITHIQVLKSLNTL